MEEVFENLRDLLQKKKKRREELTENGSCGCFLRRERKERGWRIVSANNIYQFFYLISFRMWTFQGMFLGK